MASISFRKELEIHSRDVFWTLRLLKILLNGENIGQNFNDMYCFIFRKRCLMLLSYSNTASACMSLEFVFSV